MYRELDQIDVQVMVDWHEQFKMLKLLFPVNLNFLKATYEIPYGFVHRPDTTEPPGLFRLGDQIGVIPSFTGEGMSMALHSGCLAATAFLRHGRASAVYHRQMAADIRRQIRLAFLLNKAAREHLGQAAIFALCRIWPSIMRQVASFTREREASMQGALARP